MAKKGVKVRGNVSSKVLSRKIPVKSKLPVKSKVIKKPKLTLKSKFPVKKKVVGESGEKILDKYDFKSDGIPISVTISTGKGEYVPLYKISISSITRNTEILLEKIRQELTTQVTIGMVDIIGAKESGQIEEKFVRAIGQLLEKYFPNVTESTFNFLKSYLIQRSLGLGNIEILMDDGKLEEIAVNNANEDVWVYHVNHGWMRTNIRLENEAQIKHFSSMIGRKIGRQINVLDPLMDAYLAKGERVNATLTPISVKGNTMTIRKFAEKPFTITDFINNNTISAEAASLIWLGVQYELSTLISGGTATGKTSMLNIISNFLPPNQRIISIEDTREIRLPKFLHWVPMITRIANPEGKGEVSMLDLLVNSLRMRPDRIIFGEIRRKREAEVLFEAIHTGHSVYATIHANDTAETITRLTTPPIDILKTLLPAISMVVVQYRNRRTGIRRTFQVSEINPDSTPNVLLQLDIKTGVMKKVSQSKSLLNTIEMFTGLSQQSLFKSLKERETVLKWLVKQGNNTVDGVGKIIAEYYTNKDNLMKYVLKNKKFEI